MDKISFQTKGAPLIKFQSAERIESFRAGHLYAKTLEYYRKLEHDTGDEQVGDSFEGMLHINEGIVRIKETGKEIKLQDTLLPTSHINDFVFCMFGICSNQDRFSFSNLQRNKIIGFGDTALIVLDKEELIRRITVAANKAGLECHFGAVNYYDPTIDNGNVILSLLDGMWKMAFWKREKYFYQQEARFLFSPGNGEDHIILEIGDISDITAVFSTEQVLTGILHREK